MQPHEQAQFLRAVGIFIQQQIAIATAPLLEKITVLENELRAPIDIKTIIEKLPVKEGPPGKDGDNGLDGADCDMEAVMSRVDKYIENVRPENGKDGKQGPQGPPGKDGADVVAAFRDSDGHLILTLSNGATKDIGLIHGADGKDGTPGIDGAAGKDGRDGVAYDQVKFVQDLDDPRQVNVIHAGANGEHICSFRIPGFIDKGVWRQGNYKTGDSVSVGGSMFLAQVDTDAKPETNKDWRLSVKHGRDGKQGDKGEPGDSGKPGRDGRDLTQMGFDGKKW